MFLLHILSADLVLFTSIACSMLIIVVLSLELFLLNLFPHVFIAPLWTYDPDASFSNKTNVKVILSFVVLLVLDIVAAYAVAILLNRRSLVWKVTDVFRRSSSKSLVAKIKRRLTRVSPTLTPVLPFSSPDVPTPTPKPATAGPATKGKRKILRAFSTQDHKLTLETGEEVDAAKMVSESNTLGMVHELNAFRWDLSQYVSAAYQRHMGTLLALWAFCVWQSLALTSEFIYFAKVLSSVLPKSNTTNMTDVDAFNDFMSNQTNSDYDLLRLVADTECFSGHHTCVLW